MNQGMLTDVEGLLVGQVQDTDARTGVTVVVCRAGAVGGVDVRGAAPGTRETDLLRPDTAVDRVHAVVLTGGSAFGLESMSGVMRALEAEGVGLWVADVARVPIVCGAVLFDLTCGRADVRPDIEMGKAAVAAAGKTVMEGRVGAGCGATVGKFVANAVPAAGGVGTASMLLPCGARIAALVAVNSAGDVIDPDTGRVLACGTVDGKPVSALSLLHAQTETTAFLHGNTTIGVIATDACLTKAEANRLAMVTHDGYARAIRPAHTRFDGDTVFALATGAFAGDADLLQLQAAAPEVMARAIARAVEAAR